MDYNPWMDNDNEYLINAGSLGNQGFRNIASFEPNPSMNPDLENAMPNNPNPFDYRYKELLSRAFDNYSYMKEQSIKKDASLVFTTMTVIGLGLLCVDSLIMQLIILAVAVILSFDIELQIPTASLILSIFVFRGRSSLAKGLLMLLSLISLIYFYCSSMLTRFNGVIWWINLIIVLLWVWLLFTYNNYRMTLYGGNPPPPQKEEVPLDSNLMSMTMQNEDFDPLDAY